MNLHAVEFTEITGRKFVSHYNDAVTGGRDSFTFESHEYVTTFAYYLIQYLMMHNVVSGTFDDKGIFKLAAANPNLN